MYEDKRETFTVKDVILQLLFIVLLVFLLIWLFPTKGYLEQKLDGVETSLSDSLKPLYTRLFTDNIATMKDAAKSYYTTPRLPQNVGDTTKMTLAEMYQKGLLLELVDSNNNACDADKSYVELTKTEDEYQLKTTLSCSDKEAFVIEYLGCYDYCNGKLCSKATTTTTTAAKNYKYQYVLETGGTCGNYGSWSDWSENKIEENSNTKVDTKTEKVFDHYEQVYGVVDTKFVNEDYYEDVNFGYSTKTIKKTTNRNYWVKTTTKIASYAKKQSNGSTTIPYSTRKIKKTVSHNYWTKNTTVVNAYEKKTATKDVEFGYSTKTIKRTTTYAYSYQTVITGTKWVSAGRIETTSAKSSTDSVKYTFVSSRKELDCDDACKTVNYYTYDVEKAEYTTEKKKFCAKGTDTGSNCQEVSGTRTIFDGDKIRKWDEKNIREQKLVTDYIRDILSEYSNRLDISSPYTYRAGQLAHLRTDFFFDLKDSANIMTALQALHPTPAVCGLPKNKAYRFIQENEGHDRKYYAGIVGPVENEELHLYVNLRCAQLFGNAIRLYVGSGLILESDEVSEYEEIKEKMKTIKSLL